MEPLAQFPSLRSLWNQFALEIKVILNISNVEPIAGLSCVLFRTDSEKPDNNNNNNNTNNNNNNNEFINISTEWLLYVNDYLRMCTKKKKLSR